jgi:hypothetical protein
MDGTRMVEPTDNVEKEQVSAIKAEHANVDICATCVVRVEPTVTVDNTDAVENIMADPISVDI